MNLSKTGILRADGELINENLLLTTPKSYSPSSYCGYQFNISPNMTEGTTYTISLWDVDVSHSEKAEADLGLDVYWGGGSIRLAYWHGTTYFTNGHADYLTKTFTITNAQATHANAVNSWFDIYNSVGYVAGTRNMSIGKWKLEVGSVPTIWTPYESNGIPQGFIEGSDIFRVFDGHYEANEFIEF